MNIWAIMQKILLFANIFLYFSRIYIKIMYICRRKLYSNNMQVFCSIYSIGVSLATGHWPFGVALYSAMISSTEQSHRLMETLKLALDKSTSLWKRSKLLWANPQACGNIENTFLTSNSYNYGKVFKT
jgi:hypothetical protein